jgi:hypothetical protein
MGDLTVGRARRDEVVYLPFAGGQRVGDACHLLSRK